MTIQARDEDELGAGEQRGDDDDRGEVRPPRHGVEVRLVGPDPCVTKCMVLTPARGTGRYLCARRGTDDQADLREEVDVAVLRVREVQGRDTPRPELQAVSLAGLALVGLAVRAQQSHSHAPLFVLYG